PVSPPDPEEEITLQMISDALAAQVTPSAVSPSVPLDRPPQGRHLPRFDVPDATTERNAVPKGPLKLPSNIPTTPRAAPQRSSPPGLSFRPPPPISKPDPAKESSSPPPPRMPTDPHGNPIEDWAASIPDSPDDDQWAADLVLDPPSSTRKR